jgi:3'(2'), 5'-bisphosphate nucleotidase
MLHLTPIFRHLRWTALIVTATTLTSRSVHTMSTISPRAAATTTITAKVNLLDLASSCIACTEAAGRVIKKIAEPNNQSDSQKNTRFKDDGSFVTDADFAAQGIIVQAIQSVSPDVRIVGEESAEEMAAHAGKYGCFESSVFERAKQEIRLRYHRKHIDPMPLGQGIKMIGDNNEETDEKVVESLNGISDPDECYVDASRVVVIVDPLDGTKSYAQGEYDAVSILISIVVDNEPIFGVIGKPFGYLEGANLTTILDCCCVIVYGGPLLKGVYVAGGREIVALPISSYNLDNLPRAVISSSRSAGIVQDFCDHLAEQKLIHKEPILISGAGEKSLRLILQVNNEALWFFPKKGTSLWDVAAPDAILRSLGGKLTDKFGNCMDYSKPRDDAENMEGVVACIDTDLHAICINLYSQGDWEKRVYK